MTRIFLILSLILLGFSACENKQEVDLIIRNAKIYTVDRNFNVVQGAAIHNGKFVAVGPDATIKARYTSANQLDLRGKFIFPGFIDAHSHFTYYAETLDQVDLTGTTGMDEVIVRLKAHENTQTGDWIIGFGWDQNNWKDKAMPENTALSQAFPNTPVFIWRVDGHAALVNAEGLKRTGLLNDGGKTRKPNAVKMSKKTGLLFEDAATEVYENLPKPSADKMKALIAQAQQNCFSVGLTGVCDAGLDDGEVHFLDSLQKKGDLRISVYAMLNPTTENIDRWVLKGPMINDRLHVNAIKVFIDGALGSRGALMLENYSDKPETNGILRISPDSLLKICQIAYEHNFQVCAHAIGDSANRLVLQTYSKVLSPKNDLRWRIEHAQVVNPADFSYFGKYGIIPSIQTSHYLSDKGWAIERLGPARMKSAYAWQELLKQNGWLANGSDFPVESINPVRGFYAAVSRAENSPVPKKQEQHLTRTQALKAMTIWAAMAQFEEDQKGTLEPGKWADFVVLDKNIMVIYPTELLNVAIERTYCHGELVYKRDSVKNH